MKLIIKNSKTHSLDHSVNTILAANPSLSFSEAEQLGNKIHMVGYAVVLKGTRKVCRDGAKIVRDLGGDQAAAALLKSRPGWDTLDWDAPMQTKIVQ